MIAPGVPDSHSLKIALEMGYECHRDGLWWPEYDFKKFDHSDFVKAIWPATVHNQWRRVGMKLYRSPDGNKTKVMND